jgi:predicted  nucleic acid-binding Zn-ribbon protein
MIQGFHLKVPHTTLQELLGHRVGYHRRRADEKAKELPKLREAAEAIRRTGVTPDEHTIANINKMSNQYQANLDSQIEALERDIRNHRDKAAALEFYAKHLYQDDYDLCEADLVRLELVPRA